MTQVLNAVGLVGLVLLCSLAGCGQQQPPPAEQKEPAYEGTIVAIGDSLTAGLGVPEDQAYPAQLQRLLLKQGYAFKVVNAGISGETSSGALARMAWILKLNPDMVILETGANDGLRGIDPSLTRKNLTDMIRLLQARNITVVLAGMRMVQNLGEAYTTAFADTYPSVARERGVILMPFFLQGVAARPSLNQADGIHPTADGYGVVVQSLYPHVIEAVQRWRQQPGRAGISTGTSGQPR